MQPNVPLPQPLQDIKPPEPPANQPADTEPAAPELVENIPLRQQASSPVPERFPNIPPASSQTPAPAQKPAAAPKPAKPSHPKPWLAISAAVIFAVVLATAAYYSFKN